MNDRAWNSTLPRRRHPMRRGRWSRKQSELWTAIERECPEMGKGIHERAQRDEARAEAEFARKYHSIERVFFVQALACIVPGCGRSPCENAHGDEGKEGSFKAGYRTLNPLCAHHHRLAKDSYHGLGSQAAFEARWFFDYDRSITWDYFAEQTQADWLGRGAQVIRLAKDTGQFDAWLTRRAA